MGIDEAFDALGVEPGCGRDDARRACLRAVKRCSPERDPEGFQRLRGAWDALEGWLPQWAPRAGKRAVPTTTAEAPPDAASVDVAAGDAGSIPWKLASAAPVERTEDDSELPETRPVDGAQPPVEDGRSAVPTPASDAGAEPLHAAAPGWVSAAVGSARRAMEQDAETLTPIEVLDVLRALHVAGEAPAANQPMAVAGPWLKRQGGELRALGGSGLRLRWMLKRASGTVATLLPPAASEAVASAIVDGGLGDEGGFPGCVELEVLNQRHRAAIARRLRRSAPNLLVPRPSCPSTTMGRSSSARQPMRA